MPFELTASCQKRQFKEDRVNALLQEGASVHSSVQSSYVPCR